MLSGMLIQVALPVPLFRVFDYLIDNSSPVPAIGTRVQVPFGRQNRIGVVVAHISQSTLTTNQLKTVTQVLDNKPVITTELMQLAHWLSHYYMFPLGEVLNSILPTLLRQGKPDNVMQVHWRITTLAKNYNFPKQAYKQKQQLDIIKLHGRHGASEGVLLLEGVQRPFLLKLQQKGVIETFNDTPNQPNHAPILLTELPHQLNSEQQVAVNAIYHSLGLLPPKPNFTVATALKPITKQPPLSPHYLFKSQPKHPTYKTAADIFQLHQQALKRTTTLPVTPHFQAFLLDGITGSGKTEVYLQAMQPVLQSGKQVLILVPEIGLTPQTHSRFASRFNTRVLMLHSGLNNTSRLQAWQAANTGQAHIIIGTRSAVLCPFFSLGLIIVDEEHDVSYKQQDGLRYHARDVALYRGQQTGCPVILGSATPSLESLHRVTQGKLTHLFLTKRAGNAKPASMQLVDSRCKKLNYGLTDTLIDAIRHTLAKKQQVLVFLNRRGYAPILLCESCGWQANCPRCDAHLTVHQQPYTQLHCHHCGWQTNPPKICPDCASDNLKPVGVGTARLTEGLRETFKDYPIIQIDKDTTRRKDSWQHIYSQIAKHPAAILVGTQMLAKGHHFANVTLVAMPNADRSFLSSDFRAPEKTAQLIVQVAGRAGRGEQAGKVLIQTLQPENPLLLSLINNGYAQFAQTCLQERQALGLPPTTHAALIRAESNQTPRNHHMLNMALSKLPNNHPFAIYGPIDAPMAKKASRYHTHVLLLSKNRQQLHDILTLWWQQVIDLPERRYVRLSLDIDPMSW